MNPANRAKLVNKAIEYLKTGKPDQALKPLGKLLHALPRDPDGLHLAGLAQVHLGRFERAIDLFRQAVAVAPRFALFRYNLATALHKGGHLEESRDAFRKTLELDPAMADAYMNLGTVLSQLGEHGEAEQRFREALARRPGDVHAQGNLANALMQQGRRREAMEQLRPLVTDLRRITPELALTVGSMLLLTGDHERAEQAYRRALEVQPDNQEAWAGLGSALAGRDRGQEARAAFVRAGELGRDPYQVRRASAQAALESGDYATAVAEYEALVAERPDDVPLLLSVAQVDARMGDFEAQERRLRRVLELDPQSIGAISQLASIPGRQVDDAMVERMQALAGDPAVADDERRRLAFALGDVLRGRKRYDEAFEYYALGNRLKGYVLDREAVEGFVSATIATYTPEFFRAREGWGDPSRVPVFIVGMPRSGTTLTEQIVSSHHAVFGAGERGSVSALCNSAERRMPDLTTDPGAVAALSREEVAAFARNYLENIGAEQRRVRYITNKSPGNFMGLGLIGLLFPNAPVIHTRRDPRDSLLSIFFKDFTGYHTYAYDLADLGFYYRQYLRLMAHWEQVIPNPYLPVDYEATVADQEGMTHRLLDFLGLEWEEQVLAFHQARRQVKTASLWQVRQPIYTTSLQRWRRYQAHLGPLLEALGDAVPADA